MFGRRANSLKDLLGTLETLLKAWDPRGSSDEFSALLAVLASSLRLDEVTLYEREGDWFSLVGSHKNRPVIPTPDPLQINVAQYDHDVPTYGDVYAPRLRVKSSHEQATIRRNSKPETITYPLYLGADLSGLLMGKLAKSASSKDVLKALECSAPLLARVIVTGSALRQRKDALERSQRSTAARDGVFGSTISSEHLAKTLMAQCARSIGYDAAVLADHQNDTLVTRYSWQLPSTLSPRGIHRIFHREEVFGRFFVVAAEANVLHELGIKSVLAVPIDGTESVLALLATTAPRISTEKDISTLQLYAHQLALVLARQQKFREFEQAYRESLQTNVEAIELSRAGLRGHHGRVRDLAVGLAASLHLSNETQHNIAVAAELHDVGLLGGPDAALNTALEFQHPELGAAMVLPLSHGDAIGKIIEQQHESFDGFGFPKALAGSQISQEGSILGFAEFVVEQTTASEVAGAESFQKIATRVSQQAGRRFSPAIAQAGANHLLALVDQPFTGSSCISRKSCPAHLHEKCAASKSPGPCWEVPAEIRMCSQHGDTTCDNCYVFKTWGPGNKSHDRA